MVLAHRMWLNMPEKIFAYTTTNTAKIAKTLNVMSFSSHLNFRMSIGYRQFVTRLTRPAFVKKDKRALRAKVVLVNVNVFISKTCCKVFNCYCNLLLCA